MNLTDIQTAAGAAVVVTILVQLLKPYLVERAVPLVALALGVVVVLAATLALGQTGTQPVGDAVLTGILAGASAVGLYQVQRPVGVLGPK